MKMVDVDVDDTEAWADAAFRNVDLVAHQIARFKNPWWNPPWQDLVSEDLSESAKSAPPLDDVGERRVVSMGWGFRRKRSGTTILRRIRDAKRVEKGVAAGSPGTPLDFGCGSGASTSGGEEGSSSQEKTTAKRRRSGDSNDVSGGGGSETKVVAIDRAPLVSRISALKDIRRSGKKKTISELQEEEKLLLEEKEMLQKEVESGRKAYEALRAENQRLKSKQLSLQSERAPTIAATTGAASTAQSSTTHFLLPDLNEPLSENFD